MSGNLNSNITQFFKVQFEQNCISLLLNSYESIANKNSFKELTENNITAQLIGLMKLNPLRTQLNISINREAYLDSDATYAGTEEADESSRIDMKYTVWNSNIEYDYFIEAKNLCENDWKKNGVATPVNAKKLQQRYISTGMQHFISGKYPNGCLVGYVTEGNCDNIANCINTLLTADGRNKEHLIKTGTGSLTTHYNSTHTGTKIDFLNHYLLNFN